MLPQIGGDLRLHLPDEGSQLFLIFLPGVPVDIPGVLFAVRPDGGVSALPEVFFDLLEVAGSWPAAGGLDGGELRLRAGGIFFLPGRCRLHARDPLVDAHRRLPAHLVGDVGVGVQSGGRRHMADDGGEGLDVHPVFQGHGGKGVSKLVEAENGSFSWKRKIEHGIIPSRAMVFAIVLFA